MLSKMGIVLTASGSNEGGSFGEELEEQIRMLLDDERKTDLYRSGSAPPIVECDLYHNHVNGLIRPEDEQLRSDSFNRSYYYSNVNLNPRLPSHLLPKNDLRFTRRLQGESSTHGGGENSIFSNPSLGLGFEQQGNLNPNVDPSYLFHIQNGMNNGNLHPVMRNLPSGNFDRFSNHVSENGFHYSPSLDFLTAQMAALDVNGNRNMNRNRNRNDPRSPVHFNRQESYGNFAPNGLDIGLLPSEMIPNFLEEFKNNSNKANDYQLYQVVGHIAELSVDQYGSRFIQQKLETATVEEKNMVFIEIMPCALVLMTDVFGNYVIQKFFDVGTAPHKRELVKILSGRVLSLSLQMYACRVMQKMLEGANFEQKVKLAEELAGHVIACVHDQNGNHVIQKCIECIPVEYIGFIVSTFFGQVADLSIHPYGCRVIQRVLEYCKKPYIQERMMDEILRSAKDLAQDQYGNYVIQHILMHGTQQDRSRIIHELTEIIVEMSLQKFASNVVEKCLKFGSPSEHRIIVNQILGPTDQNEPLQAMIKDQFGNYVVQRVLETSDRQLRDLVLSRIKVHMNTIKKFTYGKHICARLENLIKTCRREDGAKSPRPALGDRG